MTCITVNIVIITIGFFFLKVYGTFENRGECPPQFPCLFYFSQQQCKAWRHPNYAGKEQGVKSASFCVIYLFLWLNSVSWLIDWITECFSQAAWLKICCEEPEMLHLPEHIRSRWPWVKNSIWGPSGSSAKCLRMRSKLLPLEVATTTCVRFSEVTEKRLSFYNKPRDVSRS